MAKKAFNNFEALFISMGNVIFLKPEKKELVKTLLDSYREDKISYQSLSQIIRAIAYFSQSRGRKLDFEFSFSILSQLKIVNEAQKEPVRKVYNICDDFFIDINYYETLFKHYFSNKMLDLDI